MRALRRMLIVTLLVICVGYAEANGQVIQVENQTYSPLHYRVRTSRGFTAWCMLLPGAAVQFTEGADTSVEVWKSEDSSAEYVLEAGKSYVYYRSGPHAAPAFEAWDGPRLAVPTPPGEPRDASSPGTAFAPLESFVARCRARKEPYRLSLKKLAEDCVLAQRDGSLPDELRYLRGFTWFVGYVVDDANRDIVLLGVKDPTRPPLDIDCLATAIKSALSGSVPFCSLESHPNPKFQKSIVDGVPWNTRWAEVMIYADYDMKRVSQGHWKPAIPGFKSHIEHFQHIASVYGLAGNGEVEKNASGNASFLNRWWFNFDSSVPRAVADENGKLLYLHRNPVRVSTEQAINGAFGTKKSTISASRFADSFTHHMDELGQHYPHVAELQALYRIYDLMRHLRDVSQTAPPGMTYWARQYESPYEGPPEGMPTLTVHYKVQNRTGYGHETQSWDVRGGVMMRVGITRASLVRTTGSVMLRD